MMWTVLLQRFQLDSWIEAEHTLGLPHSRMVRSRVGAMESEAPTRTDRSFCHTEFGRLRLDKAVRDIYSQMGNQPHAKI